MYGGYGLDDTIAAIATPPGEGGVGIVKISGPGAVSIARRIFEPAREGSGLVPFGLRYGHVVVPESGEVVDEVMAAYMPAGRSYTMQDVVEIQAHGGVMPLRRIMGLVLQCGARAAGPGEMTLRAFLNGRIDLAQAEAVLDVVRARTDAALRVATEQLTGRLSGEVRRVRHSLVDVLAYLEATIDFVEDEIPPQDVGGPLREAESSLLRLLETAERGIIYREGLRAAIVGRPNVGKSSLLNALLGGERAIVTPIPGTTRDTLEEAVNVGGIPLVLVDTAGIRPDAHDLVEQMGVQRSRGAIERADLVLLVVDGSEPLTPHDDEIAARLEDKPTLLVVNKSDLPRHPLPTGWLPGAARVDVSALTGDGIDALERAVAEMVWEGRAVASDVPMVSNPRHEALLHLALEHVRGAVSGHDGRLPADLVSIDVREAVDALGQITGETVAGELLETIFGKFCIGK